MRTERRPHHTTTLIGMARGDGQASDTAQLSYNEQLLWDNDDTVLAEIFFHDLQVVHVIDLLATVGRIAEEYSLFHGT